MPTTYSLRDAASASLTRAQARARQRGAVQDAYLSEVCRLDVLAQPSTFWLGRA